MSLSGIGALRVNVILSKMDEAFSIKLSDKVYILEVFNIHHFDGLSCSAVTNRPGFYFMSHHLLKFLISLPRSLIFMQTVLLYDHVLSATIIFFSSSFWFLYLDPWFLCKQFCFMIMFYQRPLFFFHSRQFRYFMLIKIDLAIILEMISISHFCFFYLFFLFFLIGSQ